MSIIQHISKYTYDKSTKIGTHILCDILFDMKFSTNNYLHGMWPPSWILKKWPLWKSLNCHNSKYIDEESTQIGRNKQNDM